MQDCFFRFRFALLRISNLHPLFDQPVDPFTKFSNGLSPGFTFFSD
jgi:hypothetical protein